MSNTTANNTVKINWKVRFRNKVWLATMASLIISFVYGMLELLDVIPQLPEGRVIEIVQSALAVLGLVGVIADPTTAGLGDSARALGYEEPWDDNDNEGDEESSIGLTD